MAVLAILRSKSNAFPPSTVIIEQYRPPVDAYVIGKLFGIMHLLLHLMESLKNYLLVSLSASYVYVRAKGRYRLN